MKSLWIQVKKNVCYEQLFVLGAFFPISFSAGLAGNSTLTREAVGEG